MPNVRFKLLDIYTSMFICFFYTRLYPIYACMTLRYIMAHSFDFDQFSIEFLNHHMLLHSSVLFEFSTV